MLSFVVLLYLHLAFLQLGGGGCPCVLLLLDSSCVLYNHLGGGIRVYRPIYRRLYLYTYLESSLPIQIYQIIPIIPIVWNR